MLNIKLKNTNFKLVILRGTYKYECGILLPV
jgi:hypothetical protein